MMQPAKTDRTDQELLGRALQGDAEAFGDLYERYLDEIQRFVFYRAADRLEAEDLTETVFLKAWEALPRFESSNVNLRAWLYRIAHNTLIDHYRTRKVTTELSDQLHDAHPLPERVVQDLDDQKRLAMLIKTLDPTLQQVIACRFVNGLSHAETSEIMSIKEGHVRVLQLRALQKLRTLLENE